MKILVLTVFLSLCLAGMFLVFFIQDRKRQSTRSMEQDALLPFNDEDTAKDRARDPGGGKTHAR